MARHGASVEDHGRHLRLVEPGVAGDGQLQEVGDDWDAAAGAHVGAGGVGSCHDEPLVARGGCYAVVGRLEVLIRVEARAMLSLHSRQEVEPRDACDQV